MRVGVGAKAGLGELLKKKDAHQYESAQSELHIQHDLRADKLPPPARSTIHLH